MIKRTGGVDVDGMAILYVEWSSVQGGGKC